MSGIMALKEWPYGVAKSGDIVAYLNVEDRSLEFFCIWEIANRGRVEYLVNEKKVFWDGLYINVSKIENREIIRADFEERKKQLEDQGMFEDEAADIEYANILFCLDNL